MNKFDKFQNNLDTLHERPKKYLKRFEWGSNIFVILLLFGSFMTGAELLICIVPILPINRAMKLIYKDMSYVERWAKMVLVCMKYVIIELVIVVILENFAPSIFNILNFTIR